MKIKAVLLALLLVFPVYQETPYSKPLNALDKPLNPYQQCFVGDGSGKVQACNF